VSLSGRISDLQARLNISNLLRGNQIDLASLQAFARLFEALQLPTSPTPASLPQGPAGRPRQHTRTGALPDAPTRARSSPGVALTPQSSEPTAGPVHHPLACAHTRSTSTRRRAVSAVRQRRRA
jgi:hypothetical protein